MTTKGRICILIKYANEHKEAKGKKMATLQVDSRISGTAKISVESGIIDKNEMLWFKILN